MRLIQGQGDQEASSDRGGAVPEVGKRPLTESVQRKVVQAKPASDPADPAFDYSFARPAVQLKGGGAMDPAQVTSIAESGLAGGGSELPHRASLESGFGVDLSGVRAHTGGGAADASRAIGAEAYTYGSDIAFTTPSPSKELVAHEVAHVIQQRAGAGPSGGVGTAGDRFEREADSAASAVAGGGKSDLASSYAAADVAGAVQRKVVQKYESAEHAMLGDGMTYPCVVNPMELPNHAFATRGELIAFGDFYGSYDAIAQAPREETEALIGIIRWEGIWTLAGRQKQQGQVTTDAPRPAGGSLDTAAEPDDTGFHGGHADQHRAKGENVAEHLLTWSDQAWNAMVAGAKLKDKAMEIHAQFSPMWALFGMNIPLETFSHDALTVHHMKATLGRRRFRNVNNTLGQDANADANMPATTNPGAADPAGLGGDYFDLASNNLSHFAITNWATWKNYHEQVCKRVAEKPTDPAVTTRAVIEDSWGCHYLTDMYASGHAIDKQALMSSATTMMVDQSQAQGLSEAGDNKHDVIGDMLTESVQLAFRDDEVYAGWEQGCRNAFDQGLVRYDELELMLTVPRGTQWADTPGTGSVVGNLVATIMGMPWRNNQPAQTPGGDRPGDGTTGNNRESFGPGNQPQGEGAYHLGVGNLAALTAHNALNAIGFTAKNKADKTWRMQGDSHLTAETQAIAQAACDESTKQAKSGVCDIDAVEQHVPSTVSIDPSWVDSYYAERYGKGFRWDPARMTKLKTLVAATAGGVPIQSGPAAVSSQMTDICKAIMELEFMAPPGEYQAMVAREANPDTAGDGTGSMTNTGINISFLREFLKKNLPRMVPVAYAAASASDLPASTLELYKPRDAAGNTLPTGANDFVWSGSNVRFRLNVTGCEAGKTYTLGIKVHDQDSGIDYLPSGQLGDELSPKLRNDDEVYGRNGEQPDASWPLEVTIPKELPAAGANGYVYVDAAWTLNGRGDADHGEHYIRVFADRDCSMVIGRSTARDSGTTSNPAPLDATPKATGPDATRQTHFNATGIDRDAFNWDGNSVRFRLSSAAPPNTTPDVSVRAWVKQFNKDSGYDYDEHGREIPSGFFEPVDTDDLIGGPTPVAGAIVQVEGLQLSQQVVFNAIDDDGDTYIIVYGDPECSRPLGRSHVQGANRGVVRNNFPLSPATSASGFSWVGNRLSFAVAPPNAKKVYVKLFDKDSGYDYDTGGNLESGSRDEDEQYGGIREIPVTDGRAAVEATGDAAHEDTYAIVYADPGCGAPLARSNARGG